MNHPFVFFFVLTSDQEAINYESHRSSKLIIEVTLVTRGSCNTASYLASLFAIENENLTALVTNMPVGDCNTMPTLPLPL